MYLRLSPIQYIPPKKWVWGRGGERFRVPSSFHKPTIDIVFYMKLIIYSENIFN
jgi:hypothetical protein